MSTISDSIHVLHVDDEPDFADLTAEFLIRHDHRFDIETATSASEAFERLAENEYDCIVSDFDMPGQDGIEFLEDVRADHQDLPFILYTGKGSEAVASEAISAGVTDYLQKSAGTSQYEVLANRIMNAVGQLHMQTELERNEELLEHTEKLADVGGWEADVRTGEQRWTEGTYEIHDIDPDSDFDPTVEAGVNFYHPDDRDEVDRVLKRCMNDGEPYEVELRLITAEDRLRWVRSTGEPVRKDGDIITIRGAIRDITDLKERERDLQERVKELSAVHTASDLFQSVETPVGVLLSEFVERIPPSFQYPDLTEASVRFDEFEESTADFESRNHVLTERADLNDGSVLELSVGLLSDQRVDDDRPFLDEEAELLDTLVTVVKNHLERRTQRRALERTEELLTNAERLGAVGAWEVNLDTLDVFWTAGARRILGVSEEVDLTFERALEFFHSTDRDSVAEAIETCADSGEPFTLEKRLKTVDGEKRWVTIQGEPLKEGGRPYSVRGYIQDITERKERNRRYEAIFNQTYQFTGLLEPDGTLIEANESALEFGGLNRDEILGKKLWEVAWFDHSDETRERGRKAVEQAAAGDFVRQELTVQGATRDAVIDFSVRPISNAEGEVISLVPEGRDITEQKKYEHKREQIIDRVTDAIVAVDSDWRFTLVNEQAEDLYGSDEAELLGRNFWSVFEAAKGTTFEEELRGVMETREPTSFVEFFSQLDCWFDITAYPKDDGGIEFYFVDVTDHYNRARELEEKSRQLEAISRNTSEAIYIKDTEGHYQFINESGAELFGLSPTEMIGKLDDELFDGESAADIRADDRRIIESGQGITKERERFIDGERHVFLDAKYPYRDDDGEIIGIIGVSPDITERKASERDLRRQNERLGEFTSVVSHDLRNPLNVAQGRLELAQEEYDSEHLDAAANGVERSLKMIEDLLALARGGQAIGEMEPVEVADLVQTCWNHVETGDATVVADLESTIQADRSRLRQLLENLFRNAVEHGGEDVTVSIGSLPHGFYVEDGGPGIPEAKREAVWEAGYSRTEDGTGFGLAIVQQIVEAHGWEIRVTESTEGGARFEITGVEFTAS